MPKQLKYFLLAILAVGIFSAGFHGLGLIKAAPWHIVYSDTLGFYQRISAPGLPYLDKNIEYPVITGLFIQLMATLGQSRAGYYILSVFFLILFAVLATYFLYQTKQLGVQQPRDREVVERNWNKKLWLFWILAPTMLVFLIFNWDIITVLFVILAFYCVARNKNCLASFFLALGFCGKLYPIIFLIPLLLQQRGVKEWLKIIGVFAVTALAINLPFILANFDGWSYFITLNNLRNSNPDSIWTIVRFFFRNLDVPTINFLSLLLFGSSYLYLVWKFKGESVFKLCFIGILLFLIFNKVFSPQYLLWLLPFFLLLPSLKKSWFYTLEFSNLAAFFLILPWFLLGKDITYVYLSFPFVIIRHIALIAILIAALKTKLITNKNQPR